MCVCVCVCVCVYLDEVGAFLVVGILSGMVNTHEFLNGSGLVQNDHPSAV